MSLEQIVHTATVRWRANAGVLAMPLLVLAFWMIIHPYVGIKHDAVLYSASALRQLHPGLYARDFFFGTGTQFDFTIFPTLQAEAIGILGLSAANQVMLAAGHVLWLAAAALLLRKLVPANATWLSLICVVFLPPYFSGFAVLSYGEPFLTPRIFAEGLVLGGLALLLRRRWASMTAMFGLALAMHPLVALTGIGVTVAYLGLGDRRWFYLAAVVVMVCVVLAWAGIAPMDRLFQRIEPAWFEALTQRSPYLFVSKWEPAQVVGLGFDLLLVGTLAFRTNGNAGRLLRALLVTSLIGFAVALVGSDLFGNVLLTQLQPWRILWLLHVVALAALGATVVDAAKPRRRVERLRLVLFLAALTAGAAAHFSGFNLMIASGLVAPACALDVAIRRGLVTEIPGHLYRFALGITVGVGGLALYLMLGYTYHWWRVFGQLPAALGGVADIWLYWMATIAFVVTSLRLIRHPEGLRDALALVIAVACTCVAVSTWDRRSAFDRFVEEPSAAADQLRRLIPANATVFWEEQYKATWLLAQRASYYSRGQGAGVVFDEMRSREFERRRHIVAPLNTVDAVPPFRPSLEHGLRQRGTSADAIAAVCRAASALDFIMLVHPVPDMPATVWPIPVPMLPNWVEADGREPEIVTDFYIYDCAAIAGRG